MNTFNFLMADGTIRQAKCLFGRVGSLSTPAGEQLPFTSAAEFFGTTGFIPLHTDEHEGWGRYGLVLDEGSSIVLRGVGAYVKGYGYTEFEIWFVPKGTNNRQIKANGGHVGYIRKNGDTCKELSPARPRTLVPGPRGSRGTWLGAREAVWQSGAAYLRPDMAGNKELIGQLEALGYNVHVMSIA